MKAAVTSAWGVIKPTLADDAQGGTESGPGGGINVELKWSLKSYMDNGVKKWKIVIRTAYPKG